MAVTREEFEEWKQLAVTQRLLKQIQKDVEEMKVLLIHTDSEDLKELQGRCKASMNLLLVEYEDLFND
jgi:hypothetical protein